MTFNEARAEMARIANGRYHSLRYEYTDAGAEGRCSIKTSYALYLDPGMWTDYHPTWEDAFAHMRKFCGLSKETADLSGEPE